MNLICDVQLVHNTTVQTVKLYQVHTSCSHTALHHTTAYTLTLTTSHYSLHSHTALCHTITYTHTALHHTTAYALTLHYITLQPTLSHCTTSQPTLLLLLFGVSSSLSATSPKSPPTQSAHLRCSCSDLHTISPQCCLRCWETLSCGTSQK